MLTSETKGCTYMKSPILWLIDPLNSALCWPLEELAPNSVHSWWADVACNVMIAQHTVAIWDKNVFFLCTLPRFKLTMRLLNVFSKSILIIRNRNGTENRPQVWKWTQNWAWDKMQREKLMVRRLILCIFLYCLALISYI